MFVPPIAEVHSHVFLPTWTFYNKHRTPSPGTPHILSPLPGCTFQRSIYRADHFCGIYPPTGLGATGKGRQATSQAQFLEANSNLRVRSKDVEPLHLC